MLGGQDRLRARLLGGHDKLRTSVLGGQDRLLASVPGGVLRKVVLGRQSGVTCKYAGRIVQVYEQVCWEDRVGLRASVLDGQL
jgi:hypothetical protein